MRTETAASVLMLVDIARSSSDPVLSIVLFF